MASKDFTYEGDEWAAVQVQWTRGLVRVEFYRIARRGGPPIAGRLEGVSSVNDATDEQLRAALKKALEEQ